MYIKLFIIFVLIKAVSAFSQGVQTECNSVDRQITQSVLETFSDSCDQKFGSALSARGEEAYSKFKDYIETCYSDPFSFHAFGALVGVNQDRSSDPNRYPEHREWLKKVLYYNLDTLYYCSDANSIIKTMIWFDSTRGVDLSGAIAIAKYLLESGKCPFDTTNLRDGAKNDMDNWYTLWNDTVKDPSSNPFDSTLPTIDDLGLSILRGTSKVVEAKGKFSPSLVTYFVVGMNPFTEETNVKFGLSDPAFIKVEIFDALGKHWNSYGGRLFEPGENLIEIEGKSFPRGMLYARLSTLSGEVRTIKLIHY